MLLDRNAGASEEVVQVFMPAVASQEVTFIETDTNNVAAVPPSSAASDSTPAPASIEGDALTSTVTALAAPPRKSVPKKQAQLLPIPARLNSSLEQLREAVSKTSFENKSKFPAQLEEPLIDTAKLAFELEQLDDNFFNILPTIFPYNRFTLKKLVTRKIFSWRMERMRFNQDEMMTELRICIQQEMAPSLNKYLQELSAWKKEQEAKKGEDSVNGAGTGAFTSTRPASTMVVTNGTMHGQEETPGTPKPLAEGSNDPIESSPLGDPQSAPDLSQLLTPTISPQKPGADPSEVEPLTTPSKSTEMDGDRDHQDKEENPDHEKGDGEQKDVVAKDTNQAPKKKFKWTERIRLLLFEIVQIEMEIIALTNEKAKLEVKPGQSPELVSEHRSRKNLYAAVSFKKVFSSARIGA